jgi:hypothetical protein
LLASGTQAAPPDLTAGGIPDNTRTINLGPTGVRGWVYHVNSGGRRADSGDSRQVLVTAVDEGSPAAGILAPDDVILGADGTSAAPVNFTSDARKSLAYAIAEAEERTPATLQLLLWRDQVTTTVTLTLQTMGAYSSTAPYNCPKSTLILQQGLAAVMNGETAGNYSFGTLTLLAGNNPDDPDNAARITRARNEARALVPSPAVRTQMMSDERDGTSMITWERGHKLIVMAEYFLLTRDDPTLETDTDVLPGIEAYAVNIAKNSSLFGTMGHIFAEKNPDGSANGPMGGVYGPVNNAGMPCYLGLILARECGITHPAVTPAIERMNIFYRGFIGKGTVPYGEHEPAWDGHENNGKSGLAALAYTLQDERADEGKYYGKMATAAAADRELGHTGAFFNYVWAPLGAACGGDEAAASHFSRIRWMLDLNRRWDHRFDYDCLNGEGPNSGSQYNSFRMSTAALLTYALPLRQLRITGKNHDPSRWLSSTDVAEAAAADGYAATSSLPVSQLIADLASWSPCVQRRAAEQLATRSFTTSTLNQLTALANDPNGGSRYGACLALGKNSNSSTANARAATLAALLTDPENRVRYISAEAMRFLPQTAKMTQLNTILSAAATTAKPLFPLDPEDPLHFAHGRLAALLFYGGNAYGPKGMIWNNLSGVDRSLLYPAMRAVAANPVGFARSCLYHAYLQLTATDVNALAGTIVDSVQVRAPSDKMFSSGVRRGGIETLEKYKIAEGVPLCMIYAVDHLPSNDGYTQGLAVLKKYAAGSTTVTPDPEVIAFCQELLGNSHAAAAQEVLNAIAAGTSPAPLTPFKSIQSATADAASLNLPANQTTLRVAATDLAQGDSIYTWRKVRGAGNVTFTPNGTPAAKDSDIQFDDKPGTYLLEVTLSDSRGLTELYRTVEVTLRNPDGTLPANDPPVAHPQSVTTNPGAVAPVTLGGTDPEGYALVYSVTSQPTHGTLTGNAPDLTYSSGASYLGTDNFTFQVMDSEGQTSSATVTINVNGAGIELHAYEGFDYDVGSLTNRNGGIGFLSGWQNSNGTNESGYVWDETANVTFDNATLDWNGVINNGFPTSPASGTRYLGASASGSSNLNIYRQLATSAGDLADENGVLWMSAVYHLPNRGFGAGLHIGLGSGWMRERSRQFQSAGTDFIGVSPYTGTSNAWDTGNLVPAIVDSNTGSNAWQNYSRTVGASLPTGSLDMILVMKFTFGASDTVEAIVFHEDTSMGGVTEAAFNTGKASTTYPAGINESALNYLVINQGRFNNALDEIRIGNSFAAVIGVEGDPPDTTPPTLVSIVDDRAGETMQQDESVTYTLTFSEPMDPATLDASAFGNAGTSSIQINPVAQAVPGTVTVTITPVTPGSLQLRVLQDAVLTDMAGNPLDTTAATDDDTVITVNPAMIEIPFVIGMPQAAAETAIAGAGLTVGFLTEQHNGNVAAGEVMSQNPPGGTSLVYGSSVDLVVSLGPVPSVTDFALSEFPVSGTVSGTFGNTLAGDDIYQILTEMESDDDPEETRFSHLEHKWAFNVTGGETVTFLVEAHHSINNESDDFLFSYSTSGGNGPWHDMFMVTKTSDSDTPQAFVLPSGTSGPVHVRVLDTNRSAGRRVLDTLAIDQMFFLTENDGQGGQSVPDEVVWAEAYEGADLSDLSADFDGDGLSNGDERIWGLDPTRASSCNAIQTPLNPETGTFRYTRRDRALTGLTYSVWTSPDLLTWSEDHTAGQLPGNPDANGALTEDVTLSPELLNNPSLFIQVRAAE